MEARPEAIFQIEAVPSISLVNEYMPLLSTTELRGRDEFTGAELRGSASPLTTRLEKDSTVQAGDGLVRQ